MKTKKKNFYNSMNLPPKVKFNSKKPSMVQESPLDARSPQEVLEKHGMYRDESIYTKNPEKISLDLSQFGDYESNLNAVRRMKEKFNALDVDVRARFNHSVEEFTKYVTGNDFDINNVLNPREQKAYADYKKRLADEEEARIAKKKQEDYLNSAEYKQAVQESAMRAEYEKQRYEEWKSKNFPSK